MANIDSKKRARLDPLLGQISMESEKELSYCISTLMQRYCLDRKPLSHNVLAECIGSAWLAVSTFTARIYGPFHMQESRELGDEFQAFIRHIDLKTLFG